MSSPAQQSWGPGETTEPPIFREWCIVELMGHVRLAGLVTEVTLAGAGMLRIEIPRGPGMTTQYIRPETLYRLTPTTEVIARRVAALGAPEPVSRWELLPPPVAAANPTASPNFGPNRYTDLDSSSGGIEE